MLARSWGSSGPWASLHGFCPVEAVSVGQCWSERSDHFPTYALIGRRLSPVAERELPYGQEDEALLVGQGLSRLLALPPARFEHPHVRRTASI
jgi:hypothetical protein